MKGSVLHVKVCVLKKSEKAFFRKSVYTITEKGWCCLCEKKKLG